jgi:hypothetical protein
MENKMPQSLIAIIFFLAVTAHAHAGLNKTQEKALAYAKTVLADVEADSSIMTAIETRNATYNGATRAGKDTPAQIKGLEKEWRDYSKRVKLWRKSGKKRGEAKPEATGGVAAVLNSACSQALVSIGEKHNKVVEIFIMDSLGANVCTNTLTGDYDQGDEDKWIKTFKEQNSEFVDKPELDKSSRKKLTQVNFPIKSGGKIIGAITIGVKQ